MFLLITGLINGLLWEWKWKLESTILLIQLFMLWLLSIEDVRKTFCVNATFLLIQNSGINVLKEQWMDYYWLTANLLERIFLRLVIHAKLHVEFFDIICINVSTKWHSGYTKYQKMVYRAIHMCVKHYNNIFCRYWTC